MEEETTSGPVDQILAEAKIKAYGAGYDEGARDAMRWIYPAFIGVFLGFLLARILYIEAE